MLAEFNFAYLLKDSKHDIQKICMHTESGNF